ncbi:MAG: RNA polymerase sigma factor [Planctomycetota bacterium]|jgi:RNA polymerase sigma factor (sigma-70 family)
MATRERQNESALVCAARRGDREALRLLLTRNWPWLRGLAYSIIADADEVDDVLQDICVRVITKIDSVRQPERFRPWLAIVARRQALRHRQQRARRMGFSPPINGGGASSCRGRPALESRAGCPRHVGGASPTLHLAEQKCDETAPFTEDLERTEQCEQILRALKSLPEKYREIFMLQYSSDLTYRQIAEILDIPVTTVQIRLVRARRMIYDQVTGKDESKVRER